VELANPQLVQSVGALPILTLCVLVMFGQFLAVLWFVREMPRDVSALTSSVNKLLVIIERITFRSRRE
jgi:hypothetical protein